MINLLATISGDFNVPDPIDKSKISNDVR